MCIPPQGQPPEPKHFWGLRYQIEQVHDGSKEDQLLDEPVKITFTLDPNFGDSTVYKALFAAYEAVSSGKLAIGEPIEQASALFSALGTQPCSHLYYFFCHGSAPHGGGLLPADALRLTTECVEALGAEAQKSWHSFISLLPKMGKEPWMFIGNSQVAESDLRAQTFFNPRRARSCSSICASRQRSYHQ